MKKSLGIGILGFFMISALISLSGFLACASSPQQAKDPQALVMKACTACHDTGRICDALGKKDQAAWTETVTRMVGKGAAVDKESIPLVVDFLSGLKPGSPPICK